MGYWHAELRRKTACYYRRIRFDSIENYGVFDYPGRSDLDRSLKSVTPSSMRANQRLTVLTEVVSPPNALSMFREVEVAPELQRHS